MRTRRLLATVVASSALLLIGCGCSESSLNVAVAESQTVDVSQAILIDVRDVSEFEAGHLPNALNIPFNDGSLKTQLSSMDPDAAYVLYCRSGNRSGQAAAMMAEAGFDNVVDLGGLEDAVDATGLELVTE